MPEVRFFAALYLSTGTDLSVRPYPLPVEQDLFAPDAELIADDPELTARLVRHAAGSYRMRANLGLLPGDPGQYDFRDLESYRVERASMLHARINVEEPILMRGLLNILKSEMLLHHFQFRGSALGASHI